MSIAQRIASLVILVLILAALSITGWRFITPPPLMLQGEVEAKEVHVSSKIAGRISLLPVEEGERVMKGSLLVELESPEVDARLRQAEAAHRAAQAQQEKARAGARSEEIRSAYNAWKAAEANADLAERTFARIHRLHTDGVVPTQKKDEAEARMIAARKTTEAARAGYDMAMTGAREEDKAAADALTDQAEGAVSEVEAYLRETRLTAPLTAEVSTINAEEGELISPGFPVVSLVDLTDIWVVFQLREDFLTRIRMDTELPVRFPALGETIYPLKVTYISAMADFATWRATRARGDFDLKTFEVRARPAEPIPGLRPGMSALVLWKELHPAGHRP
ncbi:efflux RND transporter periplasmic adaptor subunit [Desulfobotulus sp. H1]|uniref:Efflux RND transporter periplasmic adaptor subunit n=1 Tax=Desulfobotulus pelophilus TaxID=2823377 RepID=A0ABT3N5S2_9BACT|nr:efflux RND transporter periplasmic adaptor subunit [Desulfobotulus pelophilus]MCW7752789.1 efflux RND transporter periplasmic adaptor subunit [Desulfobotulus pelophilus]